MRKQKKIPKKFSILLLFLLTASLLLLTGCAEKEQETAGGEAVSRRADDSPETYSEDQAGNLQEDDEVVYNEKLLRYVTVEDGFYIADYGESSGEEYSCFVFRMELSGREESEREMYWEIAVVKDDIVITVLRVENDEHGSAFPAPSDMAVECDVNFDGKNDILLCLGHFGNQGAVVYKCFLAEKAGFKQCAAFTEIANPSVDSQHQVIRSQWRNTAVSHGWGIYLFLGGRFVMTQRLTNEATFDNAGNTHESWRDEILINGGWITREFYNEADSEPEKIARWLNGPDSVWGLDQEWWQTEPGAASASPGQDRTPRPPDSREAESSSVELLPESYESQIRFLSDHSDLWCNHMQSDYAYVVTDLDQNGRLELISSVMEGSGRYTSSTFYEINETFDGLTVRERISVHNKGKLSEADIITENAEVYYDPQRNVYHYLFLDHIRDGASLSYYIKHSLTLEDGGITDRVLAFQTVSGVDSALTVTCEDADGRALSEDEYNRIAGKVFPDCIRMEASFSWFWPSAPEAASEDAAEVSLEENTLLAMLSKSCREFRICKE